jgi:hypothetical protein
MVPVTTDVTGLKNVRAPGVPYVSQHAQNATKEMTSHDLAFHSDRNVSRYELNSDKESSGCETAQAICRI